jgi:hypothetical protein
MILVPPAAPITSFTSPHLSIIILGHMDDRGRFPGNMKFAGDAGTPKKLMVPGVEKSSISLLYRIPVLEPITFEPKLVIRKKN